MNDLSIQWEEDPKKVKDEVKRFFKDKFREEDYSDVSLDGVWFKSFAAEDNIMLSKEFSEEEIKLVVWDCDRNKCLGHDRYNFHFIKSCWDILKDVVLRMLRDIHRNGVLPKGSNAIFLAFIPKKENP